MKYSGSIVSISGGLPGAVLSAVSNTSNCFMCFTRPPQNRSIRSLNAMEIPYGLRLLNANFLPPPVIHAPYIANLASPDENIFNSSLEILSTEIERAIAFSAKYMVIHPGCYTFGTPYQGLLNISRGLDLILDEFNFASREFYILLESMAGKGSELGKTFEELREIRDRCNHKNRIAYCLDTCHIHDYGYSIEELNFLRNKMENVLGYDLIKVCHVAGSKNCRGSQKDKHAGLLVSNNEIPSQAIKTFVNLPELDDTLFILETPDSSNYADELEFLRG